MKSRIYKLIMVMGIILSVSGSAYSYHEENETTCSCEDTVVFGNNVSACSATCQAPKTAKCDCASESYYRIANNCRCSMYGW